MRSFRKITLGIVTSFMMLNIHAQISVGVKIGANFADTRVDGLLENLAPEQTSFTGFTAGVMAEIPMINGLSFRPELNYIQKGFTVSQSFDVDLIGIDMEVGAKARTRINYVELPLLLKYSIGSDMARVYAIAGPSIAYAANAELNPVATFIVDFNLPSIPINLDNNIYNRWEISGVLGAGGEVKAGSGKVFADARYNIGLTNMLNNPVVDLRIKNQGFSVSAGYAYSF
jgi:Outer membrane protein beta-barrel domain